MPFCSNCGNEYQSVAQFCSTCGVPLTAHSSGEGVLETGIPQELPYYISLNRILLMTVLSYGLYLFYWFYRTWKQYLRPYWC